MQSADWGSLCPTNFCPLLPINCPLLPPTLQRPIQPFSWSADFFHTKACEEASKIWTADSHGWLGALSTVTARQRRSVIVYLHQHPPVCKSPSAKMRRKCPYPWDMYSATRLYSEFQFVITLAGVKGSCNFAIYNNTQIHVLPKNLMMFGNILTLRKHNSSCSKKKTVLTYVMVLTCVTVLASVWLMVLTHFLNIL